MIDFMKSYGFLFLIFFLCGPAGAGPENRPFSLKTGPGWTGPREVSLAVNPPMEFDGKTKEQVMALRRDRINQHKELFEGEYVFSKEVYGQIEDGRPWWGLQGQFCNGPGPKSIEGPSEESRFILNPFLLLMLDAPTAFICPDPGCFPVQPGPPESVQWYPVPGQLILTYRLSRYFSECTAMHGKNCGPKVVIDAQNARDLGYNYILIDTRASHGVSQDFKPGAFGSIYQLRNYIHRGGSCGYPGGCNNGSPDQPQLRIYTDYLPGLITALLWKDKPKDISRKPDVTVRIILK